MAKILVVDDSISIRKSVRFVLEQDGHVVTEAANGKEGVVSLDQQQFDLVLTDINMPEMNGFDFTRKVRSHPQHRFVPILVLTTESEGTMVQQGRDAGATGWIVKPFSNDKLLATVKKVLS
ncbi:MAG: response regulator [Spirochaetales bacterium]|nr:response regulator [Spirochaetales bacterium]